MNGDRSILREVEDLLAYHPDEHSPAGKPDVRIEPGGAIRAAVATEAGAAGSKEAVGDEKGKAASKPTPEVMARPPVDEPAPGLASGSAGMRGIKEGPASGRGADRREQADESRLPMPSRTPDEQGGLTQEYYGAPPGVETGQFPSGAVLAGRYRIVERIGRGGMGMVYRAQDLLLDQPVALKFLPESMADHPSRKARFLNEARVAVQITHANVCRVHDIGEVNGRQFISMEFVSGEDVGSLLRRVGRLPVERALALAHQICAGLAAAHEKGVLHRDLKPANVMVDDDGNAKILDFGLAGMAKGISGGEVRAGTPGYMAPEQLRGEEVTVKSDIYGLGLLLYELFTGKKAWEANSIPELMHLHKSTLPRDPRLLAPGLDERSVSVILKCLSRDPKDRPSSALAVSAMLPGGDPIAAVLAAGETPSPELVAAAGGQGKLEAWEGIAWALGVLALVIAVTVIGPRVQLQERAYLALSPEVLADRTRDTLRRLGYAERGGHEVYALDYYEELVAEIGHNDSDGERWDRLSKPRPAAIDFWYRSSPSPLRAMNAAGRVTMTDPSPMEPGMISVRLSPAGQLRELTVRYADADDIATPRGWGAPGDAANLEEVWGLLFEAADLRMSEFRPVEPSRVPPVFAETRAAWEGVYPESPEVAVRVEAAAYRGRPVAFRVIEKRWPLASVTGVPEELMTGRAGLVAQTVMVAGLVLGSLVLAPLNVTRRRGDVRGAVKVGTVCAALWLLGWELRANHVWTLAGELDLLMRAAGQALLVGGAIVVFYLALEPYVRRTWPQTLSSWERLLGGRVRDALVGQHLAIGTALGTAAAGIFYLNMLMPGWTGRPPPPPYFDTAFGMDTLTSARSALGATLQMVVASAREGMSVLLALMLIKLMVPSRWAAAAIFVALSTALWSLMASATTAYSWPLFGLLATGAALVLVRYGLLAAVVGAMVFHLLTAFPLSLDPARWYFDATVFAHAIIGTLVLFGVLTATGVVRGNDARNAGGVGGSASYV